MILLVKRKQILARRRCTASKRGWGPTKLAYKGHIRRSRTLEHPQSSLLLGWEDVLQRGSYSRSHNKARHWCLQH